MLDFNLAGGPGVFLTLHGWVNEGLMALFFLVVGLEIKRETQVGELSTLRDAALPAAGALGGVLVPAAIYACINSGTDAIGGLSAVAVIALFYAHGLHWGWLQLAAAVLVAMILCNRAGIRHPMPYALLGVALWYAMLQSGVHATVAGLLTALAIPARSRHTPADFLAYIDALRANLAAASEARVPELADALERAASAVQSPLQRIEHRLTPWVAFAVVPVFALANAGIDTLSVEWRAMAAHPIAASRGATWRDARGWAALASRCRSSSASSHSRIPWTPSARAWARSWDRRWLPPAASRGSSWPGAAPRAQRPRLPAALRALTREAPR